MLKVIVFLSVVALSCAFIVSYGSVDVHDEQVIEAANAATKALSKQLSSKYHHKLAKVLKARKESSLGGHNFQMDIVVGETTCKKEEYAFEDLAECGYRTNQSTFKKCIVSVFRDDDGTYKVGAKGCILATKKEIEGIE